MLFTKILTLLAVFYCFFAGSVFGARQTTRPPVVFSDSGFSASARDFSAGQNIYIKVFSSSSGAKEKRASLLNSEKSEVQKKDFIQNGNEFTTILTAPQTEGVYYLDIKIDDGSSVYVSQQNINVGKVEGASVSSKAESNIEINTTSGGNKISEIKITPVYEEDELVENKIPEVSEEATDLENNGIVNKPVSRIRFWWQKFFFNLTNWFK